MIVLDVEASGMSPDKCSILSIGALDLDEPTNQFYDECRVWEGAHIEDGALVVNGFTKEECLDPTRKSEADVLKAFIAWATDRPKNRTFAGQNPSFDRDFVEAACRRAGIEFPFAHRTIDTHTLCWLHMTSRGITPPEERFHSALNLVAACNYVGIPEEPKPHNALTGAFAHAEVISRIAYNKKLLPDFSSFDIPWMTN
jgi:DNA polymerase III epsilon subunit-like protein